MADLSVTAASLLQSVAAPRPAAPSGFGDALGRALADVNALQLDAEAATRALASGKAPDMTEAVVTMEKASIAFQFSLQIRNKLLEAYQDIMRMPV